MFFLTQFEGKTFCH